MPITSKSDLRFYLHADLAAHGRATWRFYDRWRFPVLAFQRHLRRVEYALNCKRGAFWAPYRAWCRLRLREHSMRLGFTIPPNTFGPRLYIVHWGTIIVNDGARIGANCKINADTCIGAVGTGVPLIGDNAYIAVGAKIIGDLTLGDDVRVGANAVVTKSFPDGSTLVGVPARSI